MSVKIIIHPSFRYTTNNVKEFHTDGKTIGDCLTALTVRFPDLRKLIFDDRERLLRHVAVYVNGESTDPGKLTKAVCDEDEILVTTVFAGG